MYETSIRTWFLSIGVAAAAAIALVSAAGSAMHQARIVAGIERGSVVALERAVISGAAVGASRKVAQACPAGADAAL